MRRSYFLEMSFFNKHVRDGQGHIDGRRVRDGGKGYHFCTLLMWHEYITVFVLEGLT